MWHPIRRSTRNDVAGMKLGALAPTMSPLTYADPAAPVLEPAFINMIELLGERAALVRLYEQWRAQ
jgi:hypothetical protein